MSRLTGLPRRPDPEENKKGRAATVKMVRASRLLLKDGGNIGKALSDFLVCPLSKQPLRYCEDSRSLISETIGVSFPIIDGIPCLVAKDGKLLEDQDKSQIENGADPSSGNSESILGLRSRVSREACLERLGPVLPLEGREDLYPLPSVS